MMAAPAKGLSKTQTKRKKEKLRKALASHLLLDLEDNWPSEPSWDEREEEEEEDVLREKAEKRKSEDDTLIPTVGASKGEKKRKKNRKKKREKNAAVGDETETDDVAAGAGERERERSRELTAATADKSKKKTVVSSKGGSQLLDRMRERMQGGQFRWLNERLYTCRGKEAFEMMQRDVSMFDNYHVGFQTQTASWPVKPVDVAIAYVQSRANRMRERAGGSVGGGNSRGKGIIENGNGKKKKSKHSTSTPDAVRPAVVVADFGCGDADLAKHFDNDDEEEEKDVVCHSFDLVSKSRYVTACNMSSVPLESNTCDVAVFCLALMGMDYPLFLKEATRVLKSKGMLWIAEVRSRFAKVRGGDSKNSDFVRMLSELLHFKLVSHDNSNKMFVTYVFQNMGTSSSQGKEEMERDDDDDEEGFVAKWPKLSSCMYKKR